jgi:hypothetical protein
MQTGNSAVLGSVYALGVLPAIMNADYALGKKEKQKPP